ncbi:hypothetical protein [Pseudanabaena sp. FACHB-2040]|uniref:hypothetical protein n=1 Tax=Pseudanabaena sp. FACHB-2040 TaxID=2692859 RepID=UPI001681C42C|nr:hypothetical protein [Pseudanabaena sp. FACHB-2040]MBD2256530.1 hypothetical protein [Pseudanabaena sp. FACHB-2040]
MPKRTYLLPLELGHRLEVSWRRGWRRCSLYLDGQRIGTIPNLKALPQQLFTLSSGATLRVSLLYSGAVPYDVGLSLNDQPLVQVRSVQLLTVALSAIGLIAGVNCMAGVFGLLNLSLRIWPNTVLLLGFGLFSPLAFGGLTVAGSSAALAVGVGGLYLFLGIRVWQRSWAALLLVLGIFFLDSVYLGFAVLTGGGEAAVIVSPIVFLRLILLVAIAFGLEGFGQPVAENTAAIHPPVPRLFFVFKRFTINTLSAVVDPIGWIFSKRSQK